MNARLLLRNFLRGAACPRPPLVPLAFYHAARLEGGSFEELLHDPTRLTRALLDQRRLLGADAVVVRLDEVLVATAAGVPVDWSAPIPAIDRSALASAGWPGEAETVSAVAAPLFDVVGRLAQELRREVSVVAVVPGPVALAGKLGPDAVQAAGQIVRTLVDGACKAGAEAVIVEEAPDATGEAGTRALLTPLINTARYYTAATLVTAARLPDGKLGDGVILPDDAAEAASGVRVGLTIPAVCFGDEAAAERFARSVAQRTQPALLTGGDAVLLGAPVEAVTALFGRLRDVAFA